MKRGKFIGKINSLLQEFHHVSPQVMMKLVNCYSTSFYGSQLWDIQSSECDRLFKAWNVMVRTVFQLDRQTHRYFIEPVSSCTHPRVMLASRFVKFHNSARNCSKLSIRLLAKMSENDHRTVMGRTLAVIRSECNTNVYQTDTLSASQVRSMCSYTSVPDDETWRINIVREMTDKNLSIPDFDQTELKTILKNICTG